MSYEKAICHRAWAGEIEHIRSQEGDIVDVIAKVMWSSIRQLVLNFRSVFEDRKS